MAHEANNTKYKKMKTVNVNRSSFFAWFSNEYSDIDRMRFNRMEY